MGENRIQECVAASVGRQHEMIGEGGGFRARPNREARFGSASIPDALPPSTAASRCSQPRTGSSFVLRSVRRNRLKSV